MRNDENILWQHPTLPIYIKHQHDDCPEWDNEIAGKIVYQKEHNRGLRHVRGLKPHVTEVDEVDTSKRPHLITEWISLPNYTAVWVISRDDAKKEWSGDDYEQKARNYANAVAKELSHFLDGETFGLILEFDGEQQDSIWGHIGNPDDLDESELFAYFGDVDSIVKQYRKHLLTKRKEINAAIRLSMAAV